MTRSIAHRNAASVFPLPVGDRMSVDSPRAIAGQPSACGAVGSPNDAPNHSATAGWKTERGTDRSYNHVVLEVPVVPSAPPARPARRYFPPSTLTHACPK